MAVGFTAITIWMMNVLPGIISVIPAAARAAGRSFLELKQKGIESIGAEAEDELPDDRETIRKTNA